MKPLIVTIVEIHVLIVESSRSSKCFNALHDFNILNNWLQNHCWISCCISTDRW